jgi:hypothetical protein
MNELWLALKNIFTPEPSDEAKGKFMFDAARIITKHTLELEKKYFELLLKSGLKINRTTLFIFSLWQVFFYLRKSSPHIFLDLVFSMTYDSISKDDEHFYLNSSDFQEFYMKLDTIYESLYSELVKDYNSAIYAVQECINLVCEEVSTGSHDKELTFDFYELMIKELGENKLIADKVKDRFKENRII